MCVLIYPSPPHHSWKGGTRTLQVKMPMVRQYKLKLFKVMPMEANNLVSSHFIVVHGSIPLGYIAKHVPHQFIGQLSHVPDSKPFKALSIHVLLLMGKGFAQCKTHCGTISRCITRTKRKSSHDVVVKHEESIPFTCHPSMHNIVLAGMCSKFAWVLQYLCK